MRNWDCCPKGHANKLTGATLHNSPTNKPIGVANKLVGRTIVDGHKKRLLVGLLWRASSVALHNRPSFSFGPLGKKILPTLFCFVLFPFLQSPGCLYFTYIANVKVCKGQGGIKM